MGSWSDTTILTFLFVIRALSLSYQVLDQFLEHAVDSRDELIEAYLIGSRLSQFLSTVLPTHPDYHGTTLELNQMRRQSQTQRNDLLQYLDQVAQLLDREQHNLYVKAVLEQQQLLETKQQDDDDYDDEPQLFATITQHREQEEDEKDVSSLQSSSSRDVTPQKSFASYQSDSSKLPLLKFGNATAAGGGRPCYDTQALLPEPQANDNDDDEESELLLSPVAESLASSNPFDGVMLSPISPLDEEHFEIAQDRQLLGIDSLEFQDNSGEQGFEQILQDVLSDRTSPMALSASKSSDSPPPPPVRSRVSEAIQKFERISTQGSYKSSSDNSRAKDVLEKVREHRLQREHRAMVTTERVVESTGRVTPQHLVSGPRGEQHYPVRYGHWQRPTSPAPTRERVATPQPDAFGMRPKGHRRDYSDHLMTDESMEGRRHDSASSLGRSSPQEKLRDLVSPMTTQSEPLLYTRLATPSFETFDTSFIIKDVPLEHRLGAEPRFSPWKAETDGQSAIEVVATGENMAKPKGPENESALWLTPTKPVRSQALHADNHVRDAAQDDQESKTDQIIHGLGSSDEQMTLRNARVEGWKQRRMAHESVSSNRAVSVGRGESARRMGRRSPSSPEHPRARRRSASPPSQVQGKPHSSGEKKQVAPKELFSSDFVPFESNAFAKPSNPKSRQFGNEDTWSTAWPEAFADPPIQIDSSMSSIDDDKIGKSIQTSTRRVRSDMAPRETAKDFELKKAASVKDDQVPALKSHSASGFDPFDEDAQSDPYIDPDIVASRKAFNQKLDAMRKQQQQVLEKGRILPQPRMRPSAPRSMTLPPTASRQSSPPGSAAFDSTLNTCHLPDQSYDLQPTLIEKRLNKAKTIKTSPTGVGGAFDDDTFWLETATTSPRRLYHHQALRSGNGKSEDEYDLIHGVNDSSHSLMTRGQRRIAMLRGCVTFLSH